MFRQSTVKHCMLRQSITKHCTSRQSITKYCMLRQSITKYCMLRQSITKYCMLRQSITKHCTLRQSITNYCVLRKSTLYPPPRVCTCQCCHKQDDSYPSRLPLPLLSGRTHVHNTKASEPWPHPCSFWSTERMAPLEIVFH